MAGIAQPSAAQLSPLEQGTPAKRGQYPFTGSSCALCHGNDGRGGLKLIWKPTGTL